MENLRFNFRDLIRRRGELFREAFVWVQTHRERFWSVVGTATVVILGVVFVIQNNIKRSEEGWVQLGNAQGYLMQNQLEAAGQAIDQWMPRFGGTRAQHYARFVQANVLYGKNQYAEASQLYSQLAQTATPADLRPLAHAAQCSAEEMAGHIPQAQTCAQQFIDRYPDHFMAASIFLAQARLAEMGNQSANAVSLYDRFIILYPQSPWAPIARARLQSLSGNPAKS